MKKYMKRIATVIGARPQFIKAAAVSRVLRKSFEEILIHTGQHYDKNMSDIFFSELNIPLPDFNLGVGSGSHAKQTADMMVGIEEILIKEKPDAVLLYGDTNSTLAGAVAAVKLHIPIIHIEAGLRSFNMLMPEEVNRILTDRVSRFLFCPTDTAITNLKNEGIVNGVYSVGDVMCDAVLYYAKNLNKDNTEYYIDKLVSENKSIIKNTWYLATIHRAENTDSEEKIKNILDGLNSLDDIVIFPVHPRIKNTIEKLKTSNQYKNLVFAEPLGYKEMLFFTKNAKKVVTDSGGLQKETYILKTPCVTVRDQTEWVETLIGGFNILAKPQKGEIVEKVLNNNIDENKYFDYYGNGKASEKIVEILKENL